jgi:hypothetical protein
MRNRVTNNSLVETYTKCNSSTNENTWHQSTQVRATSSDESRHFPINTLGLLMLMSLMNEQLLIQHITSMFTYRECQVNQPKMWNKCNATMGSAETNCDSRYVQHWVLLPLLGNVITQTSCNHSSQCWTQGMMDTLFVGKLHVKPAHIISFLSHDAPCILTLATCMCVCVYVHTW